MAMKSAMDASGSKPGETVFDGDSRPGDQQLIDDFLSGDHAAAETFSAWIRQAASRHRSRLAGEWDDMVQDLLLETTTVLRGGGFRGDCSARTFVWRIAHYRCLNRIRDAARRPENEPEKAADGLADPGRPAVDRLLARESVDLLQRFMATMSEDCRRLWDRILAGRSYREMSQETGISAGALRVRVLRCRQKAVARWREWQESADGQGLGTE